jgi:ADP-ribose pyrophosphatase
MEKTLKSTLIHKGRNISFFVDQIELPNNRKTDRDIVDHPGAVAILSVTDKGKILLINQYRYATKSDLLEVPAGTIENGEDPEKCAIRELKEETGYSAASVKKMLSCYLSPGYSNELIHIYVAKELTKGEQKFEDDEKISVQEYECDQVLTMIEEGSIRDAKTILSILYFLTSTKFY